MNVWYRSTRMIVAASLLTIGLLTFWGQSSAGPEKAHEAVAIEIKGAIGPAVADYVARGIELANQEKAHLILLKIDTPGGLATSMRVMIQAILNSPVPVVSYVSPQGARAASAGTYLLYASHVAAMAPGTNIGAATPVSIGVTDGKPEDLTKEPSSTSAITSKVTNDASAYIRSLAELRGRNIQWAELAVRQAKSLTAEEAKKKNVIDVMAESVPDLMASINGRKVRILDKTVQLNTDGMTINEIKPDWRGRFLTVITDPTIAYILMLVGIYGLLIELFQPGFILPGVIGAISILVALYAFQLLPINYVGLTLILVGIGLMIVEVLVSSFGVLGVGGIVAFILGSVMLMDTHIPGFQIALPLILSVAVMSGGLILLMVNMVIRSQNRPVVTGRDDVLASHGTVISVEHEVLRVRVNGVIWQAHSSDALRVGQSVKVVAMEGLLLTVDPIKETGEL